MTGTVIDRPPSPPIDRRIRARRIEVRRGEGRRRLRRLVVLLCASAVVVATWGIVRSPLLDIDEIHVVGVTHTDVATVVDVLGVSVGDALIDVDVDAAASRVAALPWVAGVDVTRAWGGSITVEVVERTADAVVVDPRGALWLVDADGAVLGLADPADVGGLMPIEGIAPPAPGGAVDPAHDAALRLATSIPDSVRPLVAAVEADRDGEVWVRLVARPGEVDANGQPRPDGGHVRIGDGREIDEQVRSLTTVLEQVDLTDLGVLDVRVPANPVVIRTMQPGGAR